MVELQKTLFRYSPDSETTSVNDVVQPLGQGAKKCKCGCGNDIIIKEWYKWQGIPNYIRGHYLKGKKASWVTKRNLENNPAKREDVKKKISIGNKGKIRSEEHKLMMSRLLKGNNLGMTFTEEHKKNLSKSRKGRFCGKNNPFYGKKHSLETIKKLSKNAKLRIGSNNPFYGRIHNQETKLKVSIANKGRLAWNKNKIGAYSKETIQRMSLASMGDKNGAWLGGISFEPYGLEFNNHLKEEIRKREGYKCQECRYNQKQLGYELSIHHIDFNKKNNNSNNLIALCKSCHSKTNLNRFYWTNYFQNLLGIKQLLGLQ